MTIGKNTVKPAREDLLQSVIDRMMLVGRMIRHNSEPSVPFLSHPLAHVLFTVAVHEQGMSVKELSEHIGVTPGAVTQFVNSLAERGLVEREIDPSDRRIVRLRASQLAKDDMEKIRKDALASAMKVFEVLSDEDLHRLIEILSRIDTSPLLKHPGPGGFPPAP